MKTSYFSKSALEKGAISIARYPPKWYNGLSFTRLAPPSSILNIDDFEEYSYLYKKMVLDKLNKQEVYNTLVKMAYPYEPILLCFEKDKYSCHRSLVAKWLSEVSEEPIKELGVTQMTLF